MEIGLIITLGIIFFLIIAVLGYLVFYLPKLLFQNAKSNEESTKNYFENFGKLEKENREQQEKLIAVRFEQIEKGINEGKEQQKSVNESHEKLLKSNLDTLANQQKLFGEKQEWLLKTRLDQVDKGLKDSKELLFQQQKEINERQEKLLKVNLDSLSNQQKQSSEQQEQLLKLHLDSFGQELKNSKENLSQINKLLLTPFERGRLGNIQLDRLLSLYLPKDDKIYQLEYTLIKKTNDGSGLRVDAIIFGTEGKGNLAIDSKFPLENYLASNEEKISDLEKNERIKRFKEDLKRHIKKVAEYVSEDDSIENAIMFIPSEVIFATINEQRFFEIIEFALERKVALCSPVTLAVVADKMLHDNQVHSRYRTLDEVLEKLRKFWDDFNRWRDRWGKVREIIDKTQRTVHEFDISVGKIAKHGENIKQIETTPQLTIESSSGEKE